ncbi:MAG: hypothetical protein Q7S74_02685 [Nanoarchaeota archaeon]|nr:hypothetical protein [Nanoarchaeota archaeon]
MDEQVQLAIYGINKTVKTERPGILGVGAIADIENTVIITDKRILFIAVPVYGEGMSLGGQDISGWQSILNKKGIENKGLDMIKSMTPQQILKSNSANFEIPFEYIKEVKFGWFGTVKIIDIEGRKYQYTLRKEDRNKLKLALQNYLPDKIK